MWQYGYGCGFGLGYGVSNSWPWIIGANLIGLAVIIGVFFLIIKHYKKTDKQGGVLVKGTGPWMY